MLGQFVVVLLGFGSPSTVVPTSSRASVASMAADRRDVLKFGAAAVAAMPLAAIADGANNVNAATRARQVSTLTPTTPRPRAITHHD